MPIDVMQSVKDVNAEIKKLKMAGEDPEVIKSLQEISKGARTSKKDLGILNQVLANMKNQGQSLNAVIMQLPKAFNNLKAATKNVQDLNKEIGNLSKQPGVDPQLLKNLSGIATASAGGGQALKILDTVMENITKRGLSMKDVVSSLPKAFSNFKSASQSTGQLTGAMKKLGAELYAIDTELEAIGKKQYLTKIDVARADELKKQKKGVQELSKVLGKMSEIDRKTFEQANKNVLKQGKNYKVLTKLAEDYADEKEFMEKAQAGGKSAQLYARVQAEIAKAIKDKDDAESKGNTKAAKEADNRLASMTSMKNKLMKMSEEKIEIMDTKGIGIDNIDTAPIEKVGEAFGKTTRSFDDWMDASERAKQDMNVFQRSFAEGGEQVEKYMKTLKGMPIALAATGVGVFMLTKAMADMGGKLVDGVLKYKNLNREMAITSSISRHGMFPGTKKELVALGKTLNLTRAETSELGKVFVKAASSGIGFKNVDKIAKNLKDTLGALDVSELNKAVDLLTQLPDKQINVLLNGKGSFDDEFDTYLNLMETGKLGEVIELEAKGGLGKKDLSEQGFTNKDKNFIEGQKKVEATIDDIKGQMSELIGGKLIPEVAALSTYMVLGFGAVTSAIMFAGAADSLTGKGGTKLLKGMKNIGSKGLNVGKNLIGGGASVGSRALPAAAQGAGPAARSVTMALGKGAAPSALGMGGAGGAGGAGAASTAISSGISAATSFLSTSGTALLATGPIAAMIATAAAGAAVGYGINKLGNKYMPGEENKEGAISGENNFNDVAMKTFTLGLSTSSKDLKESQDKMNAGTIKYNKTLKLGEKLHKFSTRNAKEGAKTLDLFDKEIDRGIKATRATGKARKELVEAEIQLMGNLGGSLEEYSGSVKKSLEVSTSSYGKQMSFLGDARKKIIDDETMTEGQRAIALAKITKEEATAANDWVKGLLDTIGEYDKIPDVIANNLKGAINTLKSDMIASAKFGTFTELLDASAKNVSMALENLGLALEETTKESQMASETIKKGSELAGTSEGGKKLDEANEKLNQFGISATKIDFSKTAKEIKSQIESEIQKIDVQIKDVDKRKSENMAFKKDPKAMTKMAYAQSVLEDKEIKGGGRPLFQTTGSYESTNVGEEEHASLQSKAKAKVMSGGKKAVEEMTASLGLSEEQQKEISEKFEKNAGYIDKQFKGAEREKAYIQLFSKTNKEISDVVVNANNKLDNEKKALEEKSKALSDISKNTSDSNVKLQVQKKQWEGIKKATDALNQAMQSVVDSIDKSPILQIWNSMQKQVEAAQLYQQRAGKGVENISNLVGIELEKYKSTGEALKQVEVELNKIGGEIDNQKTIWQKNKGEFDKYLSTIEGTDAGRLGAGFKTANDAYAKAQEELANTLKETSGKTDKKSMGKVSEKQGEFDKAAKERQKAMQEILNKGKEVGGKEYKAYSDSKEKSMQITESFANAEIAWNAKKTDENRKAMESAQKAKEDADAKTKESLDKLNSSGNNLAISYAKLAEEASVLEQSSLALNAVYGSYSNALRDSITKQNEMMSALQKTDDMIDTMVEQVDLSSTMRKLKMQSEAASSELELVGMSLNFKDITNAAKKYTDSVVKEETKRLDETKKAGEKSIEEQKAVLQKAMDAVKGPDDAKGAENVAMAREALERRVAKVTSDNAKQEVALKKKVVEAALKERDIKMNLIDLDSQMLDTMKERAEAVGAPFETILSYERQALGIAQQKMQTEMDALKVMQEKGDSEADQKAQAVKVEQARTELIKKQMGAQRSAMEKMFGSWQSSMKEVGMFTGTTKTAQFGKGYMTDKSGYAVQAGGKDQGGYQDRMNKINLGGGADELNRGGGKGAERAGTAGDPTMKQDKKNVIDEKKTQALEAKNAKIDKKTGKEEEKLVDAKVTTEDQKEPQKPMEEKKDKATVEERLIEALDKLREAFAGTMQATEVKKKDEEATKKEGAPEANKKLSEADRAKRLEESVESRSALDEKKKFATDKANAVPEVAVEPTVANAETVDTTKQQKALEESKKNELAYRKVYRDSSKKEIELKDKYKGDLKNKKLDPTLVRQMNQAKVETESAQGAYSRAQDRTKTATEDYQKVAGSGVPQKSATKANWTSNGGKIGPGSNANDLNISVQLEFNEGIFNNKVVSIARKNANNIVNDAVK